MDKIFTIFRNIKHDQFAEVSDQICWVSELEEFWLIVEPLDENCWSLFLIAKVHEKTFQLPLNYALYIVMML